MQMCDTETGAGCCIDAEAGFIYKALWPSACDWRNAVFGSKVQKHTMSAWYSGEPKVTMYPISFYTAILQCDIGGE